MFAIVMFFQYSDFIIEEVMYLSFFCHIQLVLQILQTTAQHVFCCCCYTAEYFSSSQLVWVLAQVDFMLSCGLGFKISDHLNSYCCRVFLYG